MTLKVHFLEPKVWYHYGSREFEEVEFTEGIVYEEETDIVVADHLYNGEFSWNNIRNIDAKSVLIRGVLEGIDYPDYETWYEENKEDLENPENFYIEEDVLFYSNGINGEEKDLAEFFRFFDQNVLNGGFNEIWKKLNSHKDEEA